MVIENKKLKEVLIAFVVLLVLAGLFLGVKYLFFSNDSQNIPHKTIEDIPSQNKKALLAVPAEIMEPSPYEQKSQADVSFETEKLKGKSRQEVETYFWAERDACKKRLEGLSGKETKDIILLASEMFRINPFKTENFLICSAIKEKNIGYCKSIPDPMVLSHCEYRVKLYLESILPSMKAGNCSVEFVQACKNSGEDDCQNLCQSLVMSKSESDCASFPKGSLTQALCLAINKRDYAACDVMKNLPRASQGGSVEQGGVGEDLWYKCFQLAYFARTVRDNNPAILEEISHRDYYSVYKLYFDPNFDCRKMLNFSEEKCDDYYNLDRLQLLFEATGAK
ncbi:MAG: hypothetical protein Q8L09_00280 [Candidatus Moranbacteria bacterium]|nr:hypothetical protein [Candidatus Moranbacteria bacterium]